MSNQVTIETKRTLANIKSYGLKVFALILNLSSVSLVDSEEDNKKKNKNDIKLDNNDKDSMSDLFLVLSNVRKEAPTCSLLVITELGDNSLGIAAESCDLRLDAKEWVISTLSNCGTFDPVMNMNNDDKVVSTTSTYSVIVKMNEGESSIKEKEKFLALNFAYLRMKKILEDSDDEEETYTLDDI